MKYLKKSFNFDNENYVVKIVRSHPVKTFKREDKAPVTNISVEKNWDKLSAYDVTLELIEAFDCEENLAYVGLCAYLAQCLVSPMWEAHMETRAECCDMSMIFCVDFELDDGTKVVSENIWNVLSEYITIRCVKDNSKYDFTIEAELNVE